MSDETKTQVVNEGAAQEAASQSEATMAEEQERFDAEYVRKLRSEAAEYRKKLRTLEEKVKAEEEAKLSEQERLQKRLAELERQRDDWERERQERSLRHEVELTAARLGIIDAEAAYRLIDLSEIEFSEDGKAKNVEAKLKELIQRKPYLASAQMARNAGAGAGNSQPDRVNMNEWIRKMVH